MGTFQIAIFRKLPCSMNKIIIRTVEAQDFKRAELRAIDIYGFQVLVIRRIDKNVFKDTIKYS